jgi:hypothetical protein
MPRAAHTTTIERQPRDLALVPPPETSSVCGGASKFAIAAAFVEPSLSAEVVLDNSDGAKRTVILDLHCVGRRRCVYRFFCRHICYWGGIAYRTTENLAPTTTKKNFKFSVIVFVKCEQWAIKWVRLLEAAKKLFRYPGTPVMPPLNEVS